MPGVQFGVLDAVGVIGTVIVMADCTLILFGLLSYL